MSFHQKPKNLETISEKCVIVNQSQSIPISSTRSFFSHILSTVMLNWECTIAQASLSLCRTL